MPAAQKKSQGATSYRSTRVMPVNSQAGREITRVLGRNSKSRFSRSVMRCTGWRAVVSGQADCATAKSAGMRGFGVENLSAGDGSGFSWIIILPTLLVSAPLPT